jgi:hypothetical protein
LQNAKRFAIGLAGEKKGVRVCVGTMGRGGEALVLRLSQIRVNELAS